MGFYFEKLVRENFRFGRNVTIRSKLIEIIEIYKRKELYYVKIQI